uniref:Uncharacterized protein n=1 Tax=Cacopsylla melanoneura TaxID=428564 RepID=A0A8D8QFE9_9HEMI
MTLSRNQILNLKKNMNIEYLKHFNTDVQTSAYELYNELQNLKELEQIELPETLLVKLSETLNTLNEEIQKNTDLKTNTVNLTELLQKEVQRKTFFEGKYNQERDNNTIISNQADADEKKFNELETQYKQEIRKLKQTNENLKTRYSELETENTKLSTETEQLKQRIKQFEDNKKIGQDSNETFSIQTKHTEFVNTQKKIMSLDRELNDASIMTTDDSTDNPNNDTLIVPPSPNQPRIPGPASRPSTSQQEAHDNSINNSTPPNLKNRLFVIGDSHCRNLQIDLKKFAHPDCRINCLALHGRKLHQIVSALKPDKLTPETNICIIAGTNDVFQTSYESMTKSYDLLYNKCKHSKIFVVLIPPRYDVKHISSHILSLNCKIKHYLSKYPNITCIDPKNILNMYSYSTDCIHLNRKGTSSLCKSVIRNIYNKIHYNTEHITWNSGTHTHSMLNRVPQNEHAHIAHAHQYTGYNRRQPYYTHTQRPHHITNNHHTTQYTTRTPVNNRPNTLHIPPLLSEYPPLRPPPLMQTTSEPNMRMNHTVIRPQIPPPAYRDALLRSEVIGNRRNFLRPQTTLV